ncbi:tetratricopeptide repeat protein [Methanospirillum lacunae]
MAICPVHAATLSNSFVQETPTPQPTPYPYQTYSPSYWTVFPTPTETDVDTRQRILDKANSWFGMGLEQLQKNNYDAAVGDFKLALLIDPGNSTIQNGLTTAQNHGNTTT